jgi:acid phosphatase family membrane protein YuiD
MKTTLLKKNNSIQDSVGNEENGCPVPDLNKMMINVTKETRDTHIKTLKEVLGRYHQEIHGEDTRHG